jgi:hypothetical protein
VVASFDECTTNLGGLYQGDGTDCESDPCPVVIGACCMEDGSCIDGVQLLECLSLGGFYQGDGTDCASAMCQVQRGACCLPDGICVDDVSPVECLLGFEGTYQGNETECGSITCPGAPNFTGLVAELVDPVAEGWDVLGYDASALDTYRIYATFMDDNALVTAVGDAVGLFELRSSDGSFFNAAVGSDFAPVSVFVDEFPDTLWDTFVTIGGDAVDGRVLVAQLTVNEGVEVTGLNWRVSGVDLNESTFFDILACFPLPCSGFPATAGGGSDDPCRADVNADGTVDVLDQLLIFECWGTDHADADMNANGVVGFDDFTMMLAMWGPCGDA